MFMFFYQITKGYHTSHPKKHQYYVPCLLQLFQAHKHQLTTYSWWLMRFYQKQIENFGVSKQYDVAKLYYSVFIYSKSKGSVLSFSSSTSWHILNKPVFGNFTVWDASGIGFVKIFHTYLLTHVTQVSSILEFGYPWMHEQLKLTFSSKTLERVSLYGS